MAQVAYVDWDGLVYYDSKIKKHLTDKLENCLKDGGKKLFAELPDPSYDNLNYVYTVADDFTSTDIFAVVGLDYAAGTVVKVSEIQLNADQPAVYRYTILNQRFSDVDADALNSVNERIKALEDAGFITEIPDDFIDENELNESLTGYATLSDLQAAVDSIPAPDLSNYYTKEEADNKYLTEHQDLSGYAKVEDVDKKISDVQAATDLNSKDIEHILDDLSKAEESISTDHARVDTLISEVGDIKTSVALKPDRADIPTATSQLANDSNYATESFVRNAILDAELNGKDIDLSGYATKDDLNTKADKVHRHKLADIEDYVAPEIPSLDGYATESYVDNAIAAIPTPDLTDYAKKTDIPDVSNFATKDEIPSIEGLATEQFVTDKISEIDIAGKADKATTLAGYGITDAYTKSQVDAKIAEIGSGGSIDLDGYVSEDEWNQRISFYITTEELEEKGYITIDQIPEPDLSDYYTKSEVDDLIPTVPTKVSELENDAGYISDSQLSEAIDEAGKIYTLHVHSNQHGESFEIYDDFAGYDKDLAYDKVLIVKDGARYPCSVDVVTTDYYKVTYLLNNYQPVVLSITKNTAGFWIATVDRRSAPYANTAYVDNKIEGLATEQFVKDSIDAIEIPETDLSNYYNKDQVNTLIEDLDIPEVPAELSAFTNDVGYLTQSDLNGYSKFSGSYNDLTDKPEIPSVEGLIKLEDVETAGYIKSDALNGYATETFVTDEINKLDIPSIAGLATETYVDNAIQGINIPDISNFITGNDVAKYIPEDYITADELSAELEKIEPPTVDLSKYYTSEQTDAAIATAVSDIDIPDVSNLATKDEVSVKANSILFTTDKIVNNAIGSFIVGDNVNGMTLSEIISKLLNLSAPTTPDTPSDSVVEDIIENKTPMYSIDGDGNVVEISYDEVLTYTAADDNTQPTESGFYQIVDDNGEVIESGYQELSANNPDVPHIIALPKGVDFNTMVTTEVFNTKTQEWVPTTLNMSNNVDDIEALCSELGVDISHIDQDVYTLWADLEAGPTGSIIRYIITEE